MSGLSGQMALGVIIVWTVGALLSGGALVWMWQLGDPARPDRKPLAMASALACAACVFGVTLGPEDASAALALMARNLALIAAIYGMFSADGRAASLRPIRPVMIALVLVQLCQPLVLGLELRGDIPPIVAAAAFDVRLLIDMLLAIGVLLMLHNLYAGAAGGSRYLMRWSVIALAGIFAYDLNLATIAYLGGEYPLLLRDLRGVFSGLMSVLFALGMSPAGPRVQFAPSRAVTFRTLSLLLVGGYLALMLLVAKFLPLIGGDFARTAQVVFIGLAAGGVALALPSPRLRGWLRVTASKHLFEHRYDYREEWLRFTRTVGRGGAGSASLEERAVKALADITESPAGLLLMPNEEAQLELTARWNWPTIAVPAIAGEHQLAGLLEQHNLVVALDEARSGIQHQGEIACLPEWLMEAEDVWALVPLAHFDRLVGVIVLARPRTPRRLDWEDFDLLRVAGQQLASYLSEQAGQQALMDASRFDDFNRRMAFVMHDIKNLASQMSLLAANAEKHAENPAFRADMLVTLRNSADKLSALLARLGRYGSSPVNDLRKIDLAVLARQVADRFRVGHNVALTRETSVHVIGNPEALEQTLVHLVQNAIDASEPDSPVYLDVTAEGLYGTVEVIDAGCGMCPEFVRTGLFKPFVSSKSGGFGIGAFEARELVKAMGGRVMVESREGLGTRFSVVLPLADAARLLGGREDADLNSPTEAA
ncbi:MAG: PEP-CTERM system histidine kinase PrsK [Erythrobacter sp.]|uniref:XrtA/PEP-CTERM system histidine kinase PrsK n=1 Tax=Erythrobacter sp. TaxID=1042 RepID=UPI002B49D8A9|nr:XrtA/PEP-CTERM system histidine kinase PrsK [Erythrobacter sp.]WRH70862.1 MAG: PEP-CTERM system histidine kinase PrsK [Erythrobacter sp.]